MTKKINDIFKNLNVDVIEEQKDLKTKNFYAFYLSLTKEEELRFNTRLKEIINSINEQETQTSKDREIAALKMQVKEMAKLLNSLKRKSLLDKIITKVFK